MQARIEVIEGTLWPDGVMTFDIERAPLYDRREDIPSLEALGLRLAELREKFNTTGQIVVTCYSRKLNGYETWCKENQQLFQLRYREPVGMPELLQARTHRYPERLYAALLDLARVFIDGRAAVSRNPYSRPEVDTALRLLGEIQQRDKYNVDLTPVLVKGSLPATLRED